MVFNAKTKSNISNRSDSMLVSEDCMYALRIFDNNAHPNYHSIKNNQKVKTMCLFGMNFSKAAFYQANITTRYFESNMLTHWK